MKISHKTKSGAVVQCENCDHIGPGSGVIYYECPSCGNTGERTSLWNDYFLRKKLERWAGLDDIDSFFDNIER